jgi:pimeloyl-ACP methyl ester carboxylesterase
MNTQKEINIQSIDYPTLAIHGSAGNGEQWNIIHNYCAFKANFFAPDLIGYSAQDIIGQREIPSLDLRLSPLLSWLEQSQSKAHIIAHSFGSALAIELVKRLPNKIASLSLYEPVVPKLLCISNTTSDEALLDTLVNIWRKLKSSESGEEVSEFLDYWANLNLWDRLSESAQQNLRSQAKAIAADFKQALSVNEMSYTRLNFSSPTQIFVGSESPKIVNRMAHILSYWLRDSYIQSLPGLGHMSPFTCPDKVFPLLLENIERIENNIYRNRRRSNV